VCVCVCVIACVTLLLSSRCAYRACVFLSLSVFAVYHFCVLCVRHVCFLVDVVFEIETRLPGISCFQVAAAAIDEQGKEWTDACEFKLPVYTPVLPESVSMSSHLDDPKQVLALPIKPSLAVVPFYGGLTIQSSCTLLQDLTDSYVDCGSCVHAFMCVLSLSALTCGFLRVSCPYLAFSYVPVCVCGYLFIFCVFVCVCLCVLCACRPSHASTTLVFHAGSSI
jgi:hypothetical protein